MGIVKSSEVTATPISAGRSRYLAHTDHLMAIVVDFKTDRHQPLTLRTRTRTSRCLTWPRVNSSWS